MSQNTLSHSLVIEGGIFMPQRTIRFSDTTIKKIRQDARKKGLTSTAIVRQAVEQALTGNEEGVERERYIAATLKQIRSDLSRMQRVQQTLFAFVDTLAKALATGLPEQSSASVARGRERYERFLKSTAATMLNGSHPLIQDWGGPMTSEAATTPVRQQIAVMGCELFEVGVFRAETSGTEASMLLRVWDPNTLMRSVPWLQF
jgi:predicted transcriptional regulator